MGVMRRCQPSAVKLIGYFGSKYIENQTDVEFHPTAFLILYGQLP